ncbi:MAG: pyridoxal phosphate-dependent aminotransferase [Bacillota bacterium]|nr:pyridoxal phosphate-dependent aminotransferase [Bacillota bacterium]
MKITSSKYEKISPSITLAITAKAKNMIKNGIDIKSFGAGEPDFQTPKKIREEAIYSIENRSITYTASSGIIELKEAICNKLKKDNNLDYNPENIVVSNGAKHSLFNTIQAITNIGDEIIIPAPYWVSYVELVKMAGGIPIILETKEEEEFQININELNKLITKKTKAILINTPNNPTGAVYSNESLKEIANTAIENDLYIISDEIYEVLLYESKHTSIVTLDERVKDRTILINGMSKAYAMTGWRIGYLACNKELAKIITNIQSHATSNPNTVAQYAAVKALSLDSKTIKEMVDVFEKRRNYMYDKIMKIDKVSCKKPKGAFYIMLNIEKLIGTKLKGNLINNSMDFANYLLDEALVAVIPGIGFGADKFVRLSYATDMDTIIEGLNRIEKAIK